MPRTPASSRYRRCTTEQAGLGLEDIQHGSQYGGPFGVALLSIVLAERAAVKGREALTSYLLSQNVDSSQFGELRRLQELAQWGTAGLSADQLSILKEMGPVLQEAQEGEVSLAANLLCEEGIEHNEQHSLFNTLKGRRLTCTE